MTQQQLFANTVSVRVPSSDGMSAVDICDGLWCYVGRIHLRWPRTHAWRGGTRGESVASRSAASLCKRWLPLGLSTLCTSLN